MAGVSEVVAQAMRYAGCPNRRSLGLREVFPRGCVTSCPFGPNAVGLQYGLHGLGWSQRLSVISRIKGAEWPAFQKFAVLPI